MSPDPNTTRNKALDRFGHGTYYHNTECVRNRRESPPTDSLAMLIINSNIRSRNYATLCAGDRFVKIRGHGSRPKLHHLFTHKILLFIYFVYYLDSTEVVLYGEE